MTKTITHESLATSRGINKASNRSVHYCAFAKADADRAEAPDHADGLPNAEDILAAAGLRLR